MNDYFRAVSLGAFTWRNKGRIALLLDSVRKAGWGRLVLHFLLVSVCLNFPVMFSIARLSPAQLYSRMYGEDFIQTLPVMDGYSGLIEEDDINAFMIESGYAANVLLPVLATAFGLILVIQTAFYLFSSFFLRIARMNASPFSFFERLGLAVFSSTLPALASAVLGLVLPAVHIMIFYFLVMFFIFQRSRIASDISYINIEAGVV